MVNNGLVKVYIGESDLKLADLIGEVFDAGENSRSRDEHDITCVGDTVKKSEPGLIDEGSQTVKLHIKEELIEKVEGWFTKGTSVQVGIVVTGSTNLSYKFKGWIKSYKAIGYTQGGQFQIEIEIKKTEHLGKFTEPAGE